jgi:PiT family inorganic phosphate transporter
MGTRIVRMEPVHGFAAQTVAATVIQLATAWGLPVSTTQVVSGSVMGAGATRRFSAVRWGVARRIAWAWVFTIPASAALAALAALLVSTGLLAVTFVILLLGTGLLVLLWRGRRLKRPASK